LGDDAHERDLERGLLDHLRLFLIELGVGFAFVGSGSPSVTRTSSSISSSRTGDQRSLSFLPIHVVPHRQLNVSAGQGLACPRVLSGTEKL